MLKRLLQSVLAPLCAVVLLPPLLSAAHLEAQSPPQPRYGVNLVASGYSTSATYAIGDLVSNTASGVTSYYLSLACQGAPKCPTYTTVQPLTVAAAWFNLGSGITQLTGDVTTPIGSGSQAATLAKFQGNSLTCSSVGNNYVPVYEAGSSAFVCAQLTLDQIAPAFAINSFSSSVFGTFEAGNSTANPASFAASYTSTPNSASISDGVNTPVNLASPFSSGSLAYSYCTPGQGLTTITFTLTAIGATTKTRTGQAVCTFRTFSGAGAGGATGATASATSAALSGATGTLASAGLGNQSSYTCTTTATQYCYVLMQGSSHTFTSGGFSFPMGTPTSVGFVNVNGVTTPLYLYQSVNNFVSGTTFTLVVASFILWPLRRRRRLQVALLTVLGFVGMGSGRMASAQGVKVGDAPYVPSTSSSQLGQTSIVMTDANCTVVGASGCTVSQGAAGPWFGSFVVTSSAALTTATRQLVMPLVRGSFNVKNGTTGGQPIVVPGASTSITIPNCSVSPFCWVFLVSDGTDVFELSSQPSGGLLASNNLSDIANAGTARSNLGLGSAATKNMVGAGTGGPCTTPSTAIVSGDLIVGDSSGGCADSGVQFPIPIAKGGTGSSSASTARSALGLGTAATQNTTGGGAAIPTGPTSSTNGDLASFTGTSGQIADSGCGIPVSVACGGLGASFATQTGYLYDTAGSISVLPGVNPACAGPACQPYGTQTNVPFTQTTPCVLSTAITSTQTVPFTFACSPYAGFPNSTGGAVNINSEIMFYSGYSSGVFTVTQRAVGTTAAAHASGQSVYGLIDATFPCSGCAPIYLVQNNGAQSFAVINPGYTASVYVGNMGLVANSLEVIGAANLASTASIANALTSVGGVTTAGAFGISPIVYSPTLLTGQTASLATTNATCNSTICPAGTYRLLLYASLTSAGTAGTLTLNCGWTDGAGAEAKTSSALALTATAPAAYVSQICDLYTSGSSNITYSTTLSGGTGSPVYAVSATMQRIQ